MSKYKTIRFPKAPVSFLVDKKAAVITAILAFVALASVIVSAGIGEMNIPPWEVVKVLTGNGSDMYTLVIQTFRLPRIIAALLVGSSLAVSGAILQGIVRNPLASPDYIGITGGASVAAIGFLTVFLNPINNVLTVSIHWQPVAAFIGAMTVALIIYGLSWKRGVLPIRLVLIGIGFNEATRAVTTMLMLFGPLVLATQSKIWITGSVYGTSWEHVKTLLPWTCGFILLAFIMARNLNVQELGDEVAAGVGSAVQRQRFFLMLISAALAAGAVAFAGGLSFVGLIAPHIARKLVGSAFGALLPASALMGGLLVLLADLLGRTAFSPLDVPAGVFTSAIGAPYFIYLLYKSRNQ